MLRGFDLCAYHCSECSIGTLNVKKTVQLRIPRAKIIERDNFRVLSSSSRRRRRRRRRCCRLSDAYRCHSSFRFGDGW